MDPDERTWVPFVAAVSGLDRPFHEGGLVGTYRKRVFLKKNGKPGKLGRRSHHTKRAKCAKRLETVSSQLFRGHQIGHYDEDTNLHVDRPSRDQAPAKGPDHGQRSV
ncbi:hypothetical protein ACODT4_43915 [Streptomyces sp. 2.9]|uniref:hypothetical protein n=1 Tax=Streptomyces tritrimontium TaxID=3406573 RepID=UPI003BB7CF09